ncbi:hypothetical protein B0A55_08362 [Friedmanniomyces simplex]|uniref:Uncharacterized protein n=1 Tax=Friedmanniomyces simplex TaxID=329884 RepID=A0A4U0XAG0_9PEZI|nr:hypothetical protein B0A55_08362 [Friedmanniomyces simplex]
MAADAPLHQQQTGAGPLARHLADFLAKRQPPKTFCPSEVARALTADELRDLGCSEWRDAMPGIRQLAWEWREREQGGGVEILQKGVVLGREVGVEDVRGPVRLRRGGG